MGTKKIKIKFEKDFFESEKHELGVCVNGYQYTFLTGMTDEQLRSIGIEIFRFLAKRKENVKKT